MAFALAWRADEVSEALWKRTVAPLPGIVLSPSVFSAHGSCARAWARANACATCGFQQLVADMLPVGRSQVEFWQRNHKTPRVCQGRDLAAVLVARFNQFERIL